jgi:hypothetical protein
MDFNARLWKYWVHPNRAAVPREKEIIRASSGELPKTFKLLKQIENVSRVATMAQ